jgi:hypothetical protein
MPRNAGQLVEVARESVLSQIRFARDEVLLAAPFLSRDVAEAVAIAGVASGARRLRFITALTARSVTAGVLDPEALRVLMDHNFELRSIQNLHAKLALVDGKWGLVGSGNFTTRGLGATRSGNIELGVVLDTQQVGRARTIFGRWWKAAERIESKDLRAYEKLPRGPRSGVACGLAHGPKLPVEVGAALGGARRRTRTGLWLKALYHDTRRDRGRWWAKVDWVSDGRPPKDPAAPKGGPTYAMGDLLLFYLVERDGPVRCCPAIAEVVAEPRYDPGFVRRNGAKGDDKQWQWVTEVRVLHDTTIERAPKLSDIDIQPQSVRQQGHIILEEPQFLAARSRITRAT